MEQTPSLLWFVAKLEAYSPRNTSKLVPNFATNQSTVSLSSTGLTVSKDTHAMPDYCCRKLGVFCDRELWTFYGQCQSGPGIHLAHTAPIGRFLWRHPLVCIQHYTRMAPGGPTGLARTEFEVLMLTEVMKSNHMNRRTNQIINTSNLMTLKTSSEVFCS